MRTLLLMACFSFWSELSMAQPDIGLQQLSSGFSLPTAVTNAGDNRLFVAEREGMIKILNPNGTVNSTPFLDITLRVVDPVGSSNEGGLLGLAFHPDYISNGYFYVNYSNIDGNSVISRFSVSDPDPDKADVNSEFILLTITQPFLNHNGGEIIFGPDGYLYIGIGDGGGVGDVANNAQNLNSLLGKVLRIDVDSGSPYGIPVSNPFYNDGDPNTRDEIWGYGFRNPYRFSFDPNTDEIWLPDVGEFNSEEINKVAHTDTGLNFGWRCYEGSLPYDLSNCPPIETLQFPLVEYAHVNNTNYRCSIIGGFVYRGIEFPAMQGKYIFADFCSSELGTLAFNGTDWDMNFSSPFPSNGFSGFGEDVNGELYVTAYLSGKVFKVVEQTLSNIDDHFDRFKLFPNPVSGNLTIDITNNQEEAYISIFDMRGSMVKTLSMDRVSSVEISTQELANGLYVVQLESLNHKPVRKKLIIR